jgi:hypothetical protein
MSKSLKDILAEAGEFEVCNGVFKRIIEYYSEDIDASGIPEHERVVLLVWHVAGIVGNGGFRYLFEGDLKGDPYFALTAKAFRATGCKEAAEAVQKTLAIFPNSRPPKDIDKRLTYYLKRCKSSITDMDRQFFAADGELKKCLANYIRAHSDAFSHLDRPQRKKKLKMSSEREEESEDESEEYLEIHNLPKWARVAFAARCARQVFPLLLRNWPQVPPERSQPVLWAAELAELSAAEGQARQDIEMAIDETIITAGAAMAMEHESGGTENAFLGDAARQVAASAQKAAESVQTDGEDSLLAALEAWHYAASAASASDEPGLLETLSQDLVFLHRAAVRGKWTDQTKVPPEIWEMR